MNRATLFRVDFSGAAPEGIDIRNYRRYIFGIMNSFFILLHSRDAASLVKFDTKFLPGRVISHPCVTHLINEVRQFYVP